MTPHQERLFQVLVEYSDAEFKKANFTHLAKSFESVPWTAEQLKAAVEDVRKNGQDEEIEIREAPKPPDEPAFAGLTGEFCHLWAPHTEASPTALAAQFLVFFGHSIGRSPYFVVSGDDHRTNLEIILVGPTSFARKGQSYGCVRRTFDKVLLTLGVPYIEGRGLSSGEGLINAVRDSSIETNKKGKRITIQGVEDKRLLVFEPEFASVLRRMVREGNTLSEVIRDVWDWGFRTMPISVPGDADQGFRDDGDHDSGMMPITRSGLIPIS